MPQPEIVITNNGATILIDDQMSGYTRLIAKAQIKELSIVKTHYLKLDLGLGALGHVYINYRDVVHPDVGDAEGLRDLINSWLPQGGGDGGSIEIETLATKEKQDNTNALLSSLETVLSVIKTQTQGLALKSGQDAHATTFGVIQAHLNAIRMQTVGAATYAHQLDTNTLLGQAVNMLNEINDKTNKDCCMHPSKIDETNPLIIFKGYAEPGAAPDEPEWAIERIDIEDGVTTHRWAEGTKQPTSVWNERQGLAYI